MCSYHLLNMQAQYTLLPKRNGRTDGSFKNLKVIKFYTNYLDIILDPKKSQIYQYSFALPEDIPQDSGVYGQAIASVKRELKDKIKYLAHSGQIIWGSVELKVPTTLKCTIKTQDSATNLEAVIKVTKYLNLKELDNEQYRPKYLQILNASLKNSLKQIKLTELGKPGQFFQHQFQKNSQEAQALYDMGLQVLKGYKATLVPLNSGIYLQLDVCSRILQSRNLLQIFNGKPQDYNKQCFEGTTVITRYGKLKTYRIESIDYNKSPMSTFDNQKKGVKMTFQAYYKQVYNIKITNTKQPLLFCIKGYKKQFIKGGKQLKVIPEYTYLVPELVSPTGMTDEQRADHGTMKALAPFTKLTPQQRVESCQYIIEDLNKSNSLIQIKGAKKFDGYTLSSPDLTYGGATIKPDNRGNIKHRGTLKQAFSFTDWVLVYNQGKNKFADKDADDAVGLLAKSGEAYGIKFPKGPSWITPNSGEVKHWKQDLQKDVQKNGVPQIIVVLLDKNEQKFYPELKKFITNTLKCPSQFIRKRTLNNPKGAMSAATKIAIQMNVKVGFCPWQVQKKHPYFKGKSMMYGALSISKGQKGYTLAFVGTTNSDCTKVFSDCKTGLKSKQEIPQEVIEKIFTDWAKTYYQENNKKVPELIILYREGLSMQQIQNQLPNMQIPAINNMVKIIGEKTKTANYNPEICLVVANKKIDTRFYMTGRENANNPNKFPPELFNPDSGSTIIEHLAQQDRNQFHLAAQYVTQGTCTPTKFIVAYDTSKMPQEALINFTYEQCFSYYNWQGAVRVPACLQCADKLSKLVSQSIKQDLVQSAVSKKHFFL